MEPTELSSWLPLIRSVVDYHVPELEASGPVFVTCAVVVVIGLLLVFHSGKIARGAVTTVGFLTGAGLGFNYASLVGVSQMLAAAVVGLIFGWFAFRSYRWWLTLGTAGVVLAGASLAQMDRPAMERLLVPPAQNVSETPTLPSPQDQLAKLRGDVPKRLEALGTRIKQHCNDVGVKGMIVPAVATVIAIALAIRWARGIAIVWMSLLGALLVFGGGAAGVCAQWPDARLQITNNPNWVLGGLGVLWVVGMIKQCREMPWMKGGKHPPAEAAPGK